MNEGTGTRCLSLKASLTVEAAWVFGITMLLIYSIMAYSFTLYSGAKEYVDKTSPDEWDAVGAFRLVDMGENILEGLGK